MSIYDRLLANDETKLAVHDVRAIACEIQRGHLTSADAAAALNLDAAEEAEFEALAKLLAAVGDAAYVWDCAYLGQRGVPGYASPGELEQKITGVSSVAVKL